jgi:hypothetical protein
MNIQIRKMSNIFLLLFLAIPVDSTHPKSKKAHESTWASKVQGLGIKRGQFKHVEKPAVLNPTGKPVFDVGSDSDSDHDDFDWAGEIEQITQDGSGKSDQMTQGQSSGIVRPVGMRRSESLGSIVTALYSSYDQQKSGVAAHGRIPKGDHQHQQGKPKPLQNTRLSRASNDDAIFGFNI